MRRLKFKPNLGASRGASGGSGASVGGGRVKGVVERVQQGGRQSGDESTGGESTSEVETGQLIEKNKSLTREREEEENSSRCRPEGPAGGRGTEGQQEATDDEHNLSSDADMTVKRTSEVCGIPHSVEPEADMSSKDTTEDGLLVSRSTLQTGMQKRAGGYRPRKKIAPKIVSVRPRRHLHEEKGSGVDLTLNQQDGSNSRDPNKASPAVVMGSSVGVLDGRRTVEGRSESEASETVSSRVSSCHGEHSSSTLSGGLQPVQRSTENVRTHSAVTTGLESTELVRSPSGQDCTDEAISNTLNEVLQGVHTSAELASTPSNFSSIARSNLDLICPTPLLSQVGAEEDETLMVDSRRADTLVEKNSKFNEDSLHKEPSASVAPGNHVSNKRTTSSSAAASTVDVVSGGHDEENLEKQSSSTGSKQSEGDVSKEKRKRPAKSGTKRKRSSISVPNDGDDPTVPSSPSPSPSPSPSSSQPKRPRTSSGRASRKVREAPDRATMTMQDLIYYNPSANPMSSTVEDKRRKQLAREEGRGEGEQQEKGERMSVQTPNSLSRQQENRVEERDEGEEDEEEEEEGRIVPQLKIGKDGSIILDEESMVVETTKKTLTEESSELVFESSSHTTSASFRKSIRVSRWTREETSKFFRALSQVGTDFTMMTLLIPRRSRKELKNKFKKEEKSNPHLVTQALKNQLSLQKLQQ